ncbi:MAG: hypothetical protein V3U87_12085 [Methylococcaceae bacterium]
MQHITQPYKGAFQVRIVLKKKERSRLFSWKPWGGKKKALIAANSWRSQVLAAYDINPNRLQHACKNNLSTGFLGVCRRVNEDKRKELFYLVYNVNWNDHTGKKRNKSFQVGNVETYSDEMDAHAFETAVEFRKEYEKHWDNNTLEKFDTGKYLGWKDKLVA